MGQYVTTKNFLELLPSYLTRFGFVGHGILHIDNMDFRLIRHNILGVECNTYATGGCLNTGESIATSTPFRSEDDRVCLLGVEVCSEVCLYLP